MKGTFLALCVGLTLAVPAVADDALAGTLDRLRRLRLEGALTEAIELAERELADPRLYPNQLAALHLELARIHDRIGLHQNSRPVAAVMHHIREAQRLTKARTPGERAAILLAKADYHYRARDYPEATPLAEAAIQWFQHAGDVHGEADAAHKLGLIHFQRGEYDPARELFDRSLELDRQAGERLVFCGDYQRHVGFILLRQGDTAAAIDYFERSRACRCQAGAIDASLFAANTLGSALVDVGRLDEARPHLTYAMAVAEKIDSPSGKARVGLVLGRMHERQQNPEEARDAYRSALRAARSIGHDSIAEQCQEALKRLGPSAVEAPNQ